MGIATSLQDGVQQTVSTWATNYSAALSTALVPVAVTGVTIYLLLMGWAIARGEVHNPTSTVIWKAFKVVLVCAIALGGGAYQQVVIDGITGIEGIFSSVLGSQDTIGALIDQNIVPLETLTGELYAKANDGLMPDFRLLTAAVLCTFGQALVTAASLIPLLVAKVTVALLLALGPVFILLVLWQPTQRFAAAWLSATIAATMTTAVVAALVGFLPFFLRRYSANVLSNLGTTNVLQDVIALVLVIIVLAWIAWKAAEFGAALANGAAFGNPATTLAHEIIRRSFRGQDRAAAPFGSMHGGSIAQAAAARAGAAANDSSAAPLAHQQVISNLHRR